MKIIGVIPARYQSSRFPGKPLADICGKPMVWWVYQEARKVEYFSRVIVATESDIIFSKLEELGVDVILTSDHHPTGTDRVAEVAERIDADLYVVIMGDEPLISAQNEKRLIEEISTQKNADAVMLIEKFKHPIDVVNMTTIKLAINDAGELIFMSRAAIPYPKETLGYSFYKNVGCYAFKKETLEFFSKTKPGNIERAEGIELLRLLENHKRIMTVEIDSESMSVDTKKDLDRVRKVFQDSRL